MKPRGFVPRHPKIPGGACIGQVRIRQWECVVHGAFRQYPSYLVRLKHYVAKVIDAALEARAQGVTVEAFCEVWELPDTRTPTRWIAGFVQRLQSIGLKAERRLDALPSSPQAATPGPQVAVPENRWQYAYVWTLLSRLQAMCHAAFQSVSRSHFVFAL